MTNPFEVCMCTHLRGGHTDGGRGFCSVLNCICTYFVAGNSVPSSEPPAYRASWDEVWMKVADDIGRRSPCARRQIGAVIVSNHNRIVSTGYNGAPAGFKPAQTAPDCTGWCSRSQGDQSTIGGSYGLSCPSIHAEANALLFADRRDFEGGTIYVTSACCQDCGKLVANSGLASVVMRLEERDMHRDPGATIDFIRSCGLEVRTV